ncbi:MFS general substrate transporter [Atractiella rhizophila]|nr:MFS general substrate transporter [Atractiella rhizophila]
MNIKQIWHSYSPAERRNIAIYIAGIMFYKVGLEFFNGSITTLATDRFNAAETFTKLGAAQGVNQAAQCVGSILVAPAVKLLPTRTVLASAVFLFSVMTALLLIVDAATGGKFKDDEGKHYGSWTPDLIFLFWTIAGIGYGGVELIRRIIPCDIVGGNVGKLRRMDATVHVWYEVAGTAGAFASSSAISRWGNNYSYFLTPVFFVFAGAIWFFVRPPTTVGSGGVVADEGVPLANAEKRQRRGILSYFRMIGLAAFGFAESVYVGGVLLLSHRRFVWLIPGYALALYLHRFLESTLGSAYAKRSLGNSAWSQIVTGGSNFGELLGAASVFALSDVVVTPMPWLRLDALALNIIWVLPHFAKIAVPGDVGWAWKVAGCFIPISFGWAAGDVSLAAYIQSALSTGNYGDKYPGVSALGAVMAFLYSTYIVLNAVFSSVLGKVIDRDYKKNGDIVDSLKRVGGIQFSVCCGIILLATFIPKGAFAFNPKQIEGVKTSAEDEEESETDESIKKQELNGDSISASEEKHHDGSAEKATV